MEISLQKAIEQAKSNPTSKFSQDLRKAIESGQLDVAAQKQGVDLTPFGRQPVKEKSPLTERIADVTGGKEIAQGLGQALAQKGTQKLIEETQKQQFDLQGKLVAQIKTAKEQGRDTTRLENALSLLNEDVQEFGSGAEKLLNPNELTNKEVVGDALQLATTAGGAKVAGAVAGKAVGATTAGQGFIQGAKAGLTGGAVTGATSGAAQGLQSNKDTEGILTDTAMGAGIGGLGGAIIGGIIGGVSGSMNGKELRQEVLKQQIASGQKPPVDTVAQKARLREAKLQGFEDQDIDFVSSMNSIDKTKAQKMVDIADKASKNKRVLERPIDVVGDSMVDRIKFIENANKDAGKNLNEVAKSLRGQAVDANNIEKTAQSLIDDLGITRTPTGKLNFDNSVFKNTPAIQKKLNKFINEIPTGQADAYDVHIFKKSIDELVEFGTQGEGLKGNAERILKALRASADEALDTTFDTYNQANTDFANTKNILNQAEELFGKKVGIKSKERGGQLLRSVFSNNTQRPRVLKLVEELDLIAKNYGGKFDDNLLDQALFTEILEDVYGTQATTSLQGQVQRAVTGGKKIVEAIKNPVQGAGELVAGATEKILGISPENKKKILMELLK
jgi:hypothetical protein